MISRAMQVELSSFLLLEYSIEYLIEYSNTELNINGK